MSFAKKSALSCMAILFSATVALAQTGGADVPTDAKKQGTKENGSSSTGMKKDGEMKGDTAKSGDMEKKSGDKM